MNKLQISKDELTKSTENVLNADQLSFLLQETPKNHVYERPGKGGGKWKFVTGVYVKKVLNLMFGWDWSFEVVEYKIDITLKQAYVLGKLTVNSQGKSIVKMQFGRVDIKFKKSDGLPLDVGNDLKAATTDALKKCAAELGVASDVYAPNEFKAISVVEYDDFELEQQIKEMLNDADGLPDEERMNIERILDQKEAISYKKAIKVLKRYK